MCSKCNGILEDKKPRTAIELLKESERRKKNRMGGKQCNSTEKP
jgi:hypothetical protein